MTAAFGAILGAWLAIGPAAPPAPSPAAPPAGLSPAPASKSPRHAVVGHRLALARCRQLAGGGDLVGLRRLSLDREERYLAVDPETLATALVPASRLRAEPMSWTALRRAFEGSPYMKAVARAEAGASALQDAGLVHALPREQGVVLTIDLCPSHRPLDRELFLKLASAFSSSERPLPIALAVTGVWMHEHPGDLDWLLERAAAGEISVTWINHSYHHAFSPSLPLSRDFLLMPGTDLDVEVLWTEIAMIARGLLPSVFFRFPGLVSDRKAFEAVLSRGLLPTCSDAWLAKGQKPGPGSIVLVHGNGNEPVGVRDFLELLQRERAEIKSRHWLLFDLRQSEDLP